MNEANCNSAKPVCKIMALVALILLAWGYFAYSRHAVWPGKCTGVNMKIENGEVRSTQLQNGILTMIVAFPEQKVTKVIVYDYCKGQVLSSVEATGK